MPPTWSGWWCVARIAASSSRDRKSTRLNSSHDQISYAVFCLKKKKHPPTTHTHGQARPLLCFPGAFVQCPHELVGSTSQPELGTALVRPGSSPRSTL